MDVIKKISHCTLSQIEKLYIRFYPLPKCEENDKNSRKNELLRADAQKFAEVCHVWKYSFTKWEILFFVAITLRSQIFEKKKNLKKERSS